MSTPPDQAARERIRTDLDHTLFVEAGAGAGKTSSLVARIANLIDADVPITSIAAITFTEKAAAELRSRLRAELERATSPTADDALERLDHAPIGTLHAFARRLLFEFPIDAGLPPGFTVLDELESTLAFEEQWDDLLDRLLDDPEPPAGALAGGRTLVELCEFDGFGISRGMRRIADDFRANWDLVADRVVLDAPPPLVVDVTEMARLATLIRATEVPDGDKQAEYVDEMCRRVDHIVAAPTLRSRLEGVDALATKYSSWTATSARGNKTNWKRAFGADGEARLDALKVLQVGVVDDARRLVELVKQHRRLLLGAIVGRFVLETTVERTRSGRLEFHDLLVLARRLLAANPRARAALHERYSRVLLDEFQDTDPIQLEIAVRLTAAPDDPAQDDPDPNAWRRLQPIAGRLFIVGDPKQSIYRFRRADIAQYLRAAGQVGADQLTLSANFRSTRAVIGFTNDVFGRAITFEADTQPAFGPLEACRAETLLDHGSVTVIGAEAHDDLGSGAGVAEALRRREADDVAAIVATALTEGWPVHDDDGGLRPCRAGDVCVLLPTRLSLPALEAALRATGVSFRAENSAVVYSTPEIRDLLLTLRAADDPTDALALLACLRSPMYGCSDVDLWTWARDGGTWSLWADPPPGMATHVVANSIAHVRTIAERIGWVAPADLLAAIAEERRVFDLALADGDPRDAWRRLRYVIEQARAWADAGGHGVRRYLAWAHLQASESRVADTILPEEDHDAVTVMTVHAAKGLEFPITIVAGLTTTPRRVAAPGVVWARDTWMLAGRGDEGVYQAQQPIDEQMSDAERRRLLYVACTRAVDHLVVSLHRTTPSKSVLDGEYSKMTSAELLAAFGAAASPGTLVRTPGPIGIAGAPNPETTELAWADPGEWAAARAEALRVASRRTGIAATRLSEELASGALAEPVPSGGRVVVDDPGLDKQPINVELPPWQRGRYGTSIGRAVHGVLQFCDLATGDDIDNLARAQCAAEGVLGLESQVAALARSALAAPIIRAAVAGAEHWRELFVAAPVGDRVLEGYVDLLIRTADGLVIVDYKTDQWSGPTQSAERIGRYRLQLAAYGAALEQAIREPIVGGVLVRCVERGAAEQIVIDDWPAALAEVRSAVAVDPA